MGDMDRITQQPIGGTDISQSVSSPLLTRKEAAAYSRVSIRKLDQAKANGELAYISVGRAIRYRVSDLEMWLNRQRVEARRS